MNDAGEFRYGDQYPDLSPYAYCANNPVRFIDPDGKSWKIKKITSNEIEEYEMEVNAVLYNNSSFDLDMDELNKIITDQINKTFTFKNKDISVKIKLNLRNVSPVEDINTDDHVFQVVDNNMLNKSVAAKTDIDGLNIRLKVETAKSTLSGPNNRTVAHEVGHTGGLNHTAGGNNLMQQSITANQIGSISDGRILTNTQYL